MIIPNQRHLFSIPGDITFLNCANMSPLMQAVEEDGQWENTGFGGF